MYSTARADITFFMEIGDFPAFQITGAGQRWHTDCQNRLLAGSLMQRDLSIFDSRAAPQAIDLRFDVGRPNRFRKVSHQLVTPDRESELLFALEV